MGYDKYTVPDNVAVEPTFDAFLYQFSIRKHTSMASSVILSNFFEEQLTQNHPQCLSGLSRALFPTTFLEIAVYETANGIFHLENYLTVISVLNSL